MVPPEAAAVCRRAFLAIYTGDLAGLSAVALPHPELATVLSKQFVPKYDLAALRQSIEEMPIQAAGGGPAEIDGVLELTVYFRGVIMPVSLVRVGGDWKMDCRWWIAGRKPDDEPRQVARAFLYAWMTADTEMLAATALAHPRLGELVRNGPPPAGEVAQLHHICEATLFLPATIGALFFGPSRRMEEVTEAHTGDGRVLLLARIGSQPPAVPIQMVKVGGAWRVDPAMLIAMTAES